MEEIRAGKQVLVDKGDGTFEWRMGEREGKGEVEERGDKEWELRACRLYAEVGSFAEVARVLGVSPYRVKKLSYQGWWQSEIAGLRKDAIAKADADYSGLLEMTCEALKDYVLNGEIVGVKEDKEGNVVVKRVPLRAIDMVRINDLAFIKRQILRNEPTFIPGETGALTVLAQKLRALGAKDLGILDVEVGGGDGGADSN